MIFLFQVWRQSQEKKKNAAKKNAEEKIDSNSAGKSKNDTSSKDIAKSHSSGKGDNEVVRLDGSNEENKENEDDDSDEIQEIPA